MKKYLILFAIIGLITGCDKEEDKNTNCSCNCDQTILVSHSLYTNAPDDDFDLIATDIQEDCLAITIGYSGGCGDIELKLIDSGVIMESYPVQRDIRLSLKDEDPCEAWIIEEVSFDLTPIRIGGDNRVSLNLVGWNNSLLYQY